MDKDKMNGGKLQYYSYLRLPNMIKSKNHSGWSSKEIPGPHPPSERFRLSVLSGTQESVYEVPR